VKPDRRTGSAGNRQATDFFARTVEPWGFDIDATPFECLDFLSGGGSLVCAGSTFDVRVSPYSLGCDVTARLITVTTVDELERCSCAGDILLMKDAICSEQLMPKNFVFYNPEHHRRIYQLLEEKQPAAIVTATKKNPDLVGAIYPFPLIEDGDFDIPSVYCTEVTGEAVASLTGEDFHLKSDARRIPSTACNVLARKNPCSERKVTVCAHIDAYGDTPGASDNASGTAVLLLLAEMLREYRGGIGIEILAINGEDNYSAGGEMDYLRRYGNDIDTIALAINIDDVGYYRGNTAYSFYNCPDELKEKVQVAFGNYKGVIDGEPWYQSDHMVFVQKGRPAIAITSDKISELMANYTHTPKDTPEIVDCRKIVEVAGALNSLVTGYF
jgi:aminopeptidase YwaD